MSGVVAGLVGSVKATVASVVNKYWFYKFSNSAALSVQSTYTDSSDNLYVLFSDKANTSFGAMYVTAYKKDGTVIWSKSYFLGASYPPTGSWIVGNAITGGGGFLYVLAGAQDVVDNGGGYLAKIDITSGSLVTIKSLTIGARQSGAGIVYLPNGNIAFTSFYAQSKGSVSYLAVVDSSLNLVWAAYDFNLGSAGYLSTDSSSNIYIQAFANCFQKFSSAGTSLAFTTGDALRYPDTLAKTDSAGNVWRAGYNYTAANTFTVAKFNSSLVYQSNFTFSLPTGFATSIYGGITVSGFDIDSSNNMYVLLWGANLGTNKALLTKISSSGTVVWSNLIYYTLATTTNFSGLSLRVTPSGDLVVTASAIGTSGNPYPVVIKVRNDGTITGTFAQGGSDTVTYSSATVSSSSYTYSATAGTQRFTSTTSLSISTVASYGSANYTQTIAGSYLN
jgi:hypothetical protein